MLENMPGNNTKGKIINNLKLAYHNVGLLIAKNEQRFSKPAEDCKK